MDADALTPLREALRQPDRRTWRRHLRPAAAAPRPPDAAPLHLGEEAADGRPATGVVGPRSLPWWAAGAAVLAMAGGIVLLGGWLPVAAPPTPRTDAALSPEALRFDPPADEENEPGATATTASSTPERLWPPAPLEVVGREVRTPAGRWEIGHDGDAIVVGDWDCDGQPTPAVLRPSTGRIAVFDRWATEDAPEPARSVSTIERAAGLRPTGRCGELTVRTDDGSDHVVDTRPAGAP